MKFLAKDTALYGGAAALNKAFALITFPLLARHFSVEEYGIIDFFSVLASLLATVFIFGQDSAVARYFYEYKEMPQRRQIITQSLVFQLMLMLLLLPLLWFLSDKFAGRLSNAAEAGTLMKLVLLQVPVLLLINFSQNILKWTFARSGFLFISLGSTIFSVLALLAGVIAFDFGLTEIFVLFLLTRAVFGFLGIWLVRQWLTRPRDHRFLWEMLRYAAPLGVICAVGAFLPAMQRTFVVEFLGERELGLFAAGSRVGMLIALPIQAFQVAWGPFSLAIFKESDATTTYNWVLKGFAVGMFAMVVLLTAVAEPIIQVLASDRYTGASVVVFAMAMGLTVEAVGWVTGVGIGFSKRSYLNLYSYGVYLVASVVGIYVLLRFFGLSGVAWGAMLGYLAKTLTESWLAQRVYPLPWVYSRVVGLGLLTIAVGSLSQLAAMFTGTWRAAIVAGLGALLVIGLGWFTVFNRAERGRMMAMLGQFSKRAIMSSSG